MNLRRGKTVCICTRAKQHENNTKWSITVGVNHFRYYHYLQCNLIEIMKNIWNIHDSQVGLYRAYYQYQIKTLFSTMRSITHELFECNLCKALESNWFLKNKLKLTVFSLDNAVNKIFLVILLTYIISFEYQWWSLDYCHKKIYELFIISSFFSTSRYFEIIKKHPMFKLFNGVKNGKIRLFKKV